MLSRYDGLKSIGERDDEWEPLELDAIGRGSASAVVEMIKQQMRMDANPDGLPDDFADSDLGVADVHTRFTVAEQLIKWTSRTHVHVGTYLSAVDRQPSSAEEAVEEDNDYTSRQEAMRAYQIHDRKEDVVQDEACQRLQARV